MVATRALATLMPISRLYFRTIPPERKIRPLAASTIPNIVRALVAARGREVEESAVAALAAHYHPTHSDGGGGRVCAICSGGLDGVFVGDLGGVFEKSGCESGHGGREDIARERV